jgi:hypothetical protein
VAWDEPHRVLRRLERVAVGYGVAGAALLYALRGSLGAALVLTLAAAASIVAFRGLQELVGRLQAGAGRSGTPESSDRRSRRLVWLRFSLLLLVPLASLWLDSERALALILGFSVLPLAILTESLLQLGFVLADRKHGD